LTAPRYDLKTNGVCFGFIDSGGTFSLTSRLEGNGIQRESSLVVTR